MLKALSCCVDIIYPPVCLYCKSFLRQRGPLALLCQSCKNRISLNAPGFCPHCGRGSQTHSDRCDYCADKSFSFDRTWSACTYEEPLKTLIHLFKYKQKLSLINVFEEFIAEFIRSYELALPEYDYLVPIPMHPAHLREREIDHARLIAEKLCKNYTLTISTGNLVRAGLNKRQAGLNARQRADNIKGCFKIKDPGQFKDKNILIIDDVFTTGSTASEAAATMKNSGSIRVDVLTLARGTI